jgi:diaminohydroxyphosphoribosylaminopyrimidine deaminase / 5-amino-6-(5-phosphoribosylamino)uracil reductase
VRSVETAPLYVLTGPEADRGRVAALREAGAEVIDLVGDRDRRLTAALDELGGRGITSLLVEGGAELAGALLGAGEVDELRVFIAPLVIGGGRPLAAGPGPERIADALTPLECDWQPSGADMLARARLREW